MHASLRLAKLSMLAVMLVSAATCSKIKTSEQDSDDRLLELYVNYPGIKPNGHRSPEFDIRLAQLMDGARKEIYWAMYGFSREIIKNSVLNAVRRGLDVQLAGDAGTYATGSAGYVQFEDLLRRYPNAKLISGNSQSIQHNKFCVIDRRYVMTGTGNITDSEIDRNYNVWVIIESKELAEDFINDHQQMMAGRFGHAKDRPDYNNVFDVGGVKVEAYFSPHEDAMSRFLQAVAEAQENIYFAIFAFTHDALGRLFIQKHKQFTHLNSQDGGKRRVRGVMDRSQLTHNQYVEVYRIGTSCGHTYGFEAGGGATNGGNTNPFTATWDVPGQANTRCYAPFDLRIDGNENNSNLGDWQAGGGRLHAKTIVIDAGTPNAKLLLGSFNWSPNANNNNDENLMVIHSPAIVERYLQFWQGIYNDGIPMNKRYPTNQELAQGIITYQTRPAGDYQKVVISEVNYAGTTRKIGNNYFAYDGNEFIELYNPNNEALDISFWSLYFPVIDTYTDPGVYTSGWPGYESLAKRGLIGLPGGTVIPAKGFLVVTQSDQRNDLDADGYLFPSSVLYDPAAPSTFGNKLSYYNPVNGLSNFFTLFDRRTSSTGRANLTSGSYTDPYTGKVYPSASPVLTFVYPMFDVAGRCRKAWAAAVDRFSGSNYFNPYHMHAGNQAGYPHLTSLWIELRDNRGNLVDIAGGNRAGAAVSGAGVSQAPTAGLTAHNEVRYFKGGFHQAGAGLVGTGTYGTTGASDTTDATRTNVLASSTPFPDISTNNFPIRGTSNAENYADLICDTAAVSTPYMVSMERAPTFGDGTNSASWQHATKNMTASGGNGGKGIYIKADYRDRTIATPGEINSRWSALP
jgi:phosphatidylserine/phosphatidylglycerophosphate/cardiolipin synthase-like enzyme